MSRVAAIDCGTNSIRLLVADVTTGSDGLPALRDIHRETRIVRLGQGVDATGELASEALERTRAALADYTAVLLRKGAERVRMVATSATRDARNRVGVAGTITTLSAVAQDLAEYDPDAVHLSRIPRADLHRIADELLGMSREERGRHRSIHPGRIDVIGGGALITDVLASELYERTGVTELVVSEHDILDGIARSIA